MGSDVSKPAAVTDEPVSPVIPEMPGPHDRERWSFTEAQMRDFGDACQKYGWECALATHTPEPQAAPQPDSRGQAREGWKLVRVEPIEAMEQFICTCDSRSGAGYTRDGEPVSPSWRTCYASLLAVASTPDEQRAQAAQEDVTQAARDVLAERRRQVEAEGWTPEHDDEHSDGEMARAASVYANPDIWNVFGATRIGWPWDASWYKPTDPRRDLVKAGALILAEIERLDRTALAGRQP